ncbi:Predicted nucleotidyltransferase [Desulfomicrobium apsheronum]|uniref:Predicted nucleotidyltransferase n=1 Tax=Desulfomicrobium apsheronum TaxID=52560 RepID=A0A1I3SE92_9BACT|nr:nucleotidyltransferase domain-containing protein [Desulfomicrobium apsheronum]SFJ56720.1 Predicted nucleotidyltransferase [Desulfomicrobium apsheronum]
MRFGLPEEAIQEIQAALALYPEVEKAILYGSRATGAFKPGSDIELTLVGEKLTHNHLLGIMSDLDDLLLPWMIDLSLLAAIDRPGLRDHIDREGQTLYER